MRTLQRCHDWNSGAVVRNIVRHAAEQTRRIEETLIETDVIPVESAGFCHEISQRDIDALFCEKR